MKESLLRQVARKIGLRKLVDRHQLRNYYVQRRKHRDYVVWLRGEDNRMWEISRLDSKRTLRFVINIVKEKPLQDRMKMIERTRATSTWRPQ
jgi:hypothetical protein